MAARVTLVRDGGVRGEDDGVLDAGDPPAPGPWD